MEWWRGSRAPGTASKRCFRSRRLANLMQKMGVQFNASAVVVKNVAAVFVTATLPPFARPGTSIDVEVSSVGDAKSLDGGMLLFTTLHGPDGQMWATAQGPLVNGGYSAGGRGNSVQVNHPTTSRIPGGGIVERDGAVDLSHVTHVYLSLRDPDFQTATEAAAAIDTELGHGSARVVDSRRIEIRVPAPTPRRSSRPAREGGRPAGARPPPSQGDCEREDGNDRDGPERKFGGVLDPARQFVGGNQHGVQGVAAASVLPGPDRQVVPQTTVKATESPAHRIELREGASVDDLINGLQAIGATPRDIVAILEAIRAAGALQAELEIL